MKQQLTTTNYRNGMVACTPLINYFPVTLFLCWLTSWELSIFECKKRTRDNSQVLVPGCGKQRTQQQMWISSCCLLICDDLLKKNCYPFFQINPNPIRHYCADFQLQFWLLSFISIWKPLSHILCTVPSGRNFSIHTNS